VPNSELKRAASDIEPAGAGRAWELDGPVWNCVEDAIVEEMQSLTHPVPYVLNVSVRVPIELTV